MNRNSISQFVPVLPTGDAPAEIDTARLQAAMASSRSLSTQRCYSSQWRLWCQWAFSKKYDILPAQPVCIADYLLDRAEAGASIATLRLVRAAIAAMHKDSGHGDPTDNQGVKRVMAGLARSQARPQRQAAGLTRDVQIAIQATAAFPRRLPSGQLESPGKAARRARMDMALVAVMRDGLLRRSEAASITWGDVEFAPDGSGRLTIKSSKTDPDGAGAVLYLSPNTVTALDQIRPTPLDFSATVFGLSARQIARRLAAAAAAAGIAGDFAGHSPRVGMAVDLAAAGCELPALMTAGRWESPTMPARYTRSETAGRGAVARYYGAQGIGRGGNI